MDLAKAGRFDVIGHGCNCRNIMGAGIAKRIREEFPGAYEADRLFRDRNPDMPWRMLGQSSFHIEPRSNGRGLYVVNMYTQLEPGSHFEYCALSDCLTENIELFQEKGEVGLPRIGCGIGGGAWHTVCAMLEDFERVHGLRFTVVNYKPA